MGFRDGDAGGAAAHHAADAEGRRGTEVTFFPSPGDLHHGGVRPPRWSTGCANWRS